MTTDNKGAMTDDPSLNTMQRFARALFNIRDEAALHKAVKKFLTKREQGLVMQEFRDSLVAQPAQAVKLWQVQRGHIVLREVIACLRESAEYRDEEGEDTDYLEALANHLGAIAPVPTKGNGNDN